MSEKRNRRSFLASDEGVRNLIEAQDKTGYTHTQIAEKSSSNEVTVSVSSVKHLFNPSYERKVGADIIRAIANTLNLHPRDIVGSEWDSPAVTTKPKQVDSGINPPDDKNPANRLIVEPEPEELVPLSSHFYIERHNVESLCYKIITQSGSLLRIKSSWGMGKTWLLTMKLLEYARQQGYQTARVDLDRADRNTLKDLKLFLQWLCVEVADSLDEVYDNLELQSKVEEWQDKSDTKRNCRKYFQNYLLSNITTPLVLAIDNCELLFKSPVFSEFFPLLRAWHNNAKPGDRFGSIWRKLRIVLVYSTETYPDLDINHSPFNVGEVIELPDFNPSEVATLAKLHELDEQLGENRLLQLMNLIGGHPALIQQALNSLKRQQTTLEQLLSLASTEQGIYGHYLREQLLILQQNSHLKLAYREVVTASESIRLDAEVAFKLHSIGLVKFSANSCLPRYDLYRNYFSMCLR